MILARKLMCLRLLKDDGVNWNKNRNQGYNLRRAPCAQMLIAVFVQAFLRIYLYTNMFAPRVMNQNRGTYEMAAVSSLSLIGV